MNNKSKLIVVCGIPGAGKTTISKDLSKKLNITCLHKDSIIEYLYFINKAKTLEESKKISKIAIQLFFKLAEEQIRNKVDLMIESAFNFEEDVNLFEKWKKDYNLDLYCIICSIDEETRKSRFNSRCIGREAFHDNEKKDDPNTCFNRTDFDYNTMPGKKIKIITNEDIEKITKKLTEFIFSKE